MYLVNKSRPISLQTNIQSKNITAVHFRRVHPQYPIMSQMELYMLKRCGNY